MHRMEFVRLAKEPGTSFRSLCRRFGISAKTGYKWRRRAQETPEENLEDRSRRPKSSPGKCEEPMQEAVVALRREHPTWGGRKLRRRLIDMGVKGVPAASTCTEIIRRKGLPMVSTGQIGAHVRFEKEHPNELWQMDFKGHFPTLSGARCHPFTILDDHSRYSLALEPCVNQRGATVKTLLTRVFERYGLPQAILCDNGAPWGKAEDLTPHTALSVWLLRLGVKVYHGRPYHPQTQGKEERFHRTLAQELINARTWKDLAECERLFPGFRHVYNCERPHDALGGDTPAQHYRPSPRSMPDVVPMPEYLRDDIVLIVRSTGIFTFASQTWRIGRAFASLPVALRQSPQSDRQWQVWFGLHRLGSIDLDSPSLPKHQLRSIYPSTTNP